jgi:hypothetical protein
MGGNRRILATDADTVQAERAARDPKHRMALVFRWYLGLSSRWANAGEPSRRVDYQVWCGPAMGAFNEWTRGSYLQDWRNRRVADVARNLLWGRCVCTDTFAGVARSGGRHSDRVEHPTSRGAGECY